jgi:two-component system sensor histidine kinase HydH
MGLPHTHKDDIIILGLKMMEYESARRSDIQHALIMGAILVIMGSGALFFILVIQNYYLVDRTLKQTQDYTRQVVASMANGLLSIDMEGKITSYNPAAAELLGLNNSQVNEVDFRTITNFPHIGIEKTLNDCQAILDKEISYQKENGQKVPLAVSTTPIKNKGNACQGAVIILRDLREIKRLEEKVRRTEKLAAIGELAAGIAHEIRNPLSSIRGFAQFLSQVLKDKPQEQVYAATMVSEVDRINSVVTDLLTFARPMKAELLI